MNQVRYILDLNVNLLHTFGYVYYEYRRKKIPKITPGSIWDFEMQLMQPTNKNWKIICYLENNMLVFEQFILI